MNTCIGLSDDGDDEDEDGGDEPLITELDLVTQVPADLLEPSQPAVEQNHTPPDHTPTPEAHTHTQQSEREVHLTRANMFYTKLIASVINCDRLTRTVSLPGSWIKVVGARETRASLATRYSHVTTTPVRGGNARS